jgi:prepilin-type N-terminal cleavage/methylation domain-containing protein
LLTEEEKEIRLEGYRFVGEQKRGAGFSLIELLVVLAVVSVLTGILLPVLAKVRRRAGRIRCMTNQREIVSGVNLYALDHDNRYPPSVASVGTGTTWNWGEPRKMTALFQATIGPHRAMSEYLHGYVGDASVMFCPGAPERYKYLQRAWDAGDAWNNPDTWLLEDAMNGTYCFWWNYTGLLEGRLFKGPRNLLGGRGESELLVSDYLGYANWRNELCYGGDYFAYGSCELFKGANITPGEPTYAAGSAFWSGPESDGYSLSSIKIKLHAGFADGHVESYTAQEVVTMKVIKDRFTNEPYEYDEHGPGYFYLPMDALH